MNTWLRPMKADTFTAYFHFDAHQVPTTIFRNVPGLADDYLTELNRTRALGYIALAKKWLRRNGKAEHLVNCYDNTDPSTGKGEVAIVLNDLDTALLLKMAIG